VAGELGFDTGPYVRFAVFCEHVIEDKSGVLTIVRIIDRVTVSQSEGPDDLPPGGVIATTLAVGLTAGQARGRQTVMVTIEHPDGSRHPGPEVPVHFTQGTAAGVNVILKIGLTLSTTGFYWADVLVNGRIVTRLPLEVRYQVIPPDMQLQ
jgi:hypothetical protein